MITIEAGGQVRVSGAWLRALDDDERRALARLVQVESIGNATTLKSRLNRIGTVSVGGQQINVLSGLAPVLLTRMFLYANGEQLDRYVHMPPVKAEETTTHHPELAVLLSSVVVYLAGQVLRRHVSQTYEAHTEWLSSIRGRLHVVPPIGAAGPGKVLCTHHLKSTDNSLNAIVLAGLIEANRHLREVPSIDRQAQSQLFAWADLVTDRPISHQHVLEARSRLTRQTEHYRPLLDTIETLLFSSTPLLFSGSGARHVPAIVVNLDVVFESVVARLVVAGLRDSAQVRVQHTMRQTVLDGTGEEYFRPRPDVVVFANGLPALVVDAKYKPGYVVCSAKGAPAKKVDRGDLYQMFFYANRLADRYALQKPPSSCIVAPSFGLDPVPNRDRLRVSWSDGDSSGVTLEVLPLNLPAVLEAVASGAAEIEALAAHAPAMTQMLALSSCSDPTAA